MLPSGSGAESPLTSRLSCSSVISISVTEQVCVVSGTVTETFHLSPEYFHLRSQINTRSMQGAADIYKYAYMFGRRWKSDP